MLDTIRKIYYLLTPRERWQALALLVAITATGLLEVLGVASILPFMSLLAQPEIIQENEWLSRVYNSLGFSSSHSFLMFLGFLVLGLMVLTNSLLAATNWLMERFVWNKHHELSRLLLKGYLARPYASFLNRNTAELSKNVLLEAYYLSRSVLSPLMELVASFVSTLFIVGLLVVVDSVLTLAVAGGLGGAYVAIYLALRRKIGRIGKKRQAADAMRFKTTNEALGGIKDVKVLGREAHFVRRYAGPSKDYAGYMATNAAISSLPRYLLETLAFGGILLIVLYLMSSRGDVRQIIPIVGLYAFAGYRVMPAFKTMFKSLTQIRFQQATVEILYRELRENEPALQEESRQAGAAKRLSLQKAIELQAITFAYPGAMKPSIENIHLTIPYRQSIALVGPTGAGKTTLVDVFLGLFMPQEGCLMVDGVPISPENVRNWQAMLGYVPQHIFLADDTVTRNIAFGVPDEEIDQAAVERAARIANLHDFIMEELPHGYETLVGERGVRLSGGQRQRIGIARAVYHDPDVLVLDEATSALDSITEGAVLQAIENIAQTKTMIVIAHRLSTVRNCDVIYLMDKGSILVQGTYDELLQSNQQFQLMVQAASNNGADLLNLSIGT
ncbi:MAG: ABC transporter ATP-binding protein/permease [Chloroflexi bacterium]|nr:ABC transporter ATP-binding protein/permease [Chloroflexota bacterium]